MNLLNCLCVLLLAGATIKGDPAGMFDVKSYGAVGDGIHDDTAAIQRTCDAAKVKLSHGMARTVYFPPGRYLISDRILLHSLNLHGDDMQIIQKNPDKSIFHYEYAWSVRLSGLEMHGGKEQISLGNTNTDKSRFVIDNCRFFRSKEAGIIARKGSNSALFSITDAQFIECGQAVISHCDWTTLRNVWITSDRKMRNRAVIENHHGVMTLDNMLGVPLCNGENQRWIDNYTGSIYAEKCRFGGEGGGFTVIYNYAHYSPFGNAMGIVLRQCWISAQSNYRARTAVYCLEVPNFITIEDCTMTGISGIEIAPGLVLKDYFHAQPDMLKFHLNNIGTGSNNMPEELRRPQIHPLRFPGKLSPAAVAVATAKIMETVAPGQPAADVDLLGENTLQWDAADHMDGTSLLNSEFLRIVRRGNPTCLMRILPVGGNSSAPDTRKEHFSWVINADWPHVTIRDIKVDIAQFPFFLIETRSDSPAEFSVKLIDEEAKKLYQLWERQVPPGHYEIDLLKKFPELKTTKQISMRIYYLGRSLIPARDGNPFYFANAAPGSCLIIRQLGFSRKATGNRGK